MKGQHKTEEKLQVEYMTILLCIFQTLALHIIYLNTVRTCRQPSSFNNALFSASLFHMLTLLSLYSIRAMSARNFFHDSCEHFLGFFDAFFIYFQTMTTILLVWKTVGWLKNRKWRTVIGLLLGVLPLAETGCLIVGLASRRVTIENDRCTTKGAMVAKLVGKYVLTTLYALLAAVFLVFTLILLKNRRKRSEKGASTSALDRHYFRRESHLKGRPMEDSKHPNNVTNMTHNVSVHTLLFAASMQAPYPAKPKSLIFPTIVLFILSVAALVTTLLSAQVGMGGLYKFVVYCSQNYIVILSVTFISSQEHISL
jgi:hypothetical protein